MDEETSHARYVKTGNDDKWQVVEFGPPGSLQYRLMFLDKQSRAMSPWHSIPLYVGDGQLNFLCKTPRGTWGKFEVADDEDFNPLRFAKNKSGQAPAHYSENCKWNFGVFPQTWADPEQVNVNYGGIPYDAGPLEIIEIGSRTSKTGEVYSVKPVAAFSVISKAACLSWKIVAIATDDLLAGVLTDVADINRCLPGTLEEIREWLRCCNSSESSEEENLFGMNERPAPHAVVAAVIAECHGAWQLLNDSTAKPEPWLPRAKPMKPSTFESMWVKYTERESKDTIPLADSEGRRRSKLIKSPEASPGRDEGAQGSANVGKASGVGGGAGNKARKLLGFLTTKPRFGRPSHYASQGEGKAAKPAGSGVLGTARRGLGVGSSGPLLPNHDTVSEKEALEKHERVAGHSAPFKRRAKSDTASSSDAAPVLQRNLSKVAEDRVSLMGEPKALPPRDAGVPAAAPAEPAWEAEKAEEVESGGEEQGVDAQGEGAGLKGGPNVTLEEVAVFEEMQGLVAEPRAEGGGQWPPARRARHASQDFDAERSEQAMALERGQEMGAGREVPKWGRARSMGQVDGARLAEQLELDVEQDGAEARGRHLRSASMGAAQGRSVIDRIQAGEDHEDHEEYGEQDGYEEHEEHGGHGQHGENGDAGEDCYEYEVDDEEVLDAQVVRYADDERFVEDGGYGADARYEDEAEYYEDEESRWNRGAGNEREVAASEHEGARGFVEGMHGFQRVETMPLKGERDVSPEEERWSRHRLGRSSSLKYLEDPYEMGGGGGGYQGLRRASSLGHGRALTSGELVAAALAPEMDEEELGNLPEATVISRHNSSEASEFSEPDNGEADPYWDEEGLDMDLPVAPVMGDYQGGHLAEQDYDVQEQYRPSTSSGSCGGGEGQRGHRRKVSFAEDEGYLYAPPQEEGHGDERTGGGGETECSLHKRQECSRPAMGGSSQGHLKDHGEDGEPEALSRGSRCARSAVCAGPTPPDQVASLSCCAGYGPRA